MHMHTIVNVYVKTSDPAWTYALCMYVLRGVYGALCLLVVAVIDAAERVCAALGLPIKHARRSNYIQELDSD